MRLVRDCWGSANQHCYHQEKPRKQRYAAPESYSWLQQLCFAGLPPDDRNADQQSQNYRLLWDL